MTLLRKTPRHPCFAYWGFACCPHTAERRPAMLESSQRHYLKRQPIDCQDRLLVRRTRYVRRRIRHVQQGAHASVMTSRATSSKHLPRHAAGFFAVDKFDLTENNLIDTTVDFFIPRRINLGLLDAL